MHFFRPQQEVVRPNAKLKPKLPKKYEVDEGGAVRCKHILVSCFICGDLGSLAFLLFHFDVYFLYLTVFDSQSNRTQVLPITPIVTIMFFLLSETRTLESSSGQLSCQYDHGTFIREFITPAAATTLMLDLLWRVDSIPLYYQK